MARTSTDALVNIIACCNDKLADLGVDGGKLDYMDAYGRKRLVWVYDTSATKDFSVCGSTRDLYDAANTLYDVLYMVAQAQ